MLLRHLMLRLRPARWWVAAALLLTAAAPLAGQQIPGQLPGQLPTPQEARELLRTRPELIDELRERLALSGLTPDQIRARLRAAGYPEDLLDPYLADADTSRQIGVAPGTLDAVEALGLLAPEALDTLRLLDSIRLVSDSVRRIADSLMLLRADSLRADSLADSVAMRDAELKRFGIEVFRRTSTQFEPTFAGPVDENYRLGPGDVLVLILTGDVEQAYTLDVTREGFVVIPQVGQVYVANLTLEQLEDQLYTRLGRVYSGVRRGPGATTRFDVTVARLRNIQVFVAGDVVRPGAYQISAAATPLTALYAAGGPTLNGSFRRIQIRRGGELIDSLDVYEYLLHGINPTDTRLQSGDVVFVPVRSGLVDVTGAAMRPAIYEVKPNETLRDVLAFAGGFAATAYQSRVQIHRVLPADSRGPGGRARVVVEVGEDQFAGGVVPAVPIFPGDSVTVFEVPEPVRSYVTVEGNVWVEGQVGWKPGMRLQDAIRLAGGVQPDVYLDRILITRMREDSTRIQLRSSFVDSTGVVADNLVLEDRDVIRVFSRTAFQPTMWISVSGAVREPGRIPYREGMTMRDALLLAGGPTPDAWLNEAEIARRAGGGEPGTLAETIRVPLDSSYAFGRPRYGPSEPVPGGSSGGSGGAQPEVVLQPYDNVLIMRQPGWALQRLVYLGGQVKYPGQYALRSKTERLSDLIERAGGLTDQAYAGGIEFYRVRNLTRGRVEENGDGDSALDSTPPRTIRERVGVDLVRALDDDDSHENLILAAGDSIYIPEQESIVMVRGAVNAPGAVAYTPGKNLDWYVRAAGGYSSMGDEDRAYVTQPNGKKAVVQRRFLLPDGNPEPRPGAVVFVPTRLVEEQPSNLPSILGTAAQVIGALVTVIVVANR